MVSDKNEWINELIYTSYRDLPLQTLLKNLYSFFSIHMPLSYLTLYRYQDGTITKIAMHTNYKGLFSSPDVVRIPDDIMQALHLDTTNSGTWYQTRICSESAGYPYSKVSKMLHPNPGTSIFVPLDYFINYGELRYLSVFSLGECSYTQDHVELCETIRKPLGAAVRDILLMGEQKKGEHREHDRNSYLSDESQGEPQTFRSLDEHTADYIRQVIKHTNGRISGKNGAAAILGLPPTTLWSKMRKLKISSR